MSQVAIVIDVPDYGPEILPGNTLLRIAGNTVKDIKKQLPVDDGVRLVEVAVAPKLHIEQEWPEPVVVEEAEPEKPKRKVKTQAEKDAAAAKRKAAKDAKAAKAKSEKA